MGLKDMKMHEQYSNATWYLLSALVLVFYFGYFTHPSHMENKSMRLIPHSTSHSTSEAGEAQ